MTTKAIPPTALEFADVTTTAGYLPTGSEATYNAGTTYGAGAFVKYTEGGGFATTRIYESLQASNTGNTPAPDHTSGPTAWWKEVSPPLWDAAAAYNYGGGNPTINRVIYNKQVWNTKANPTVGVPPDENPTHWEYYGPWTPWAMFQYDTSAVTTGTSPLVVTITPGVKTNSVGVFGSNCETIRLQASSTAGGGSIYDSTINMEDTLSGNWYNQVYGVNRNKTALAVFDVPAYSDTVYTLTFTNTTSTPSVGACMVGTYVDIGDAEVGCTSELANYSTITRDANTGLVTLSAEAPVPVIRARMLLTRAAAQHAFRLRRDLNGVPAAWVFVEDMADEYFEMISVSGIYRRFPLQITQADIVYVDLEVESI